VDEHREEASTAPLNTRVPGSPEWCYQTMGLLKSSYRMIHIDHEDFTHHLNELREHRAWEKVPVDLPYGSEDRMLAGELGKRADELNNELNAIKREQLAAQNRELNATTPDLKNVGHPSSNPDTNKNDIRVGTREYGTSDEYAIAKLRKEAKADERIEAIYQRVLAGELSPNAGMVDAGFRKKRASKKQTPFEIIVKQLPKLTDDQLDALFNELLARKGLL
jgi:hypothetical protein